MDGPITGLQDGRVVAFDDHRGLGTVETPAGTRYPFHCVAVADGSRHADVGAAVRFHVVAGRLGVWEADGISSA